MKYNIYFSPTGGTKKVVTYLGELFENTETIDLSMDVMSLELDREDFCVIGVPSYGGRMPQIAVERLKQLHGRQTPAVLVVTYGNRAYEDTLRELKDAVERQGFICIGAAAVVTQHSIMAPYGAGRPDAEDKEQLEAFVLKMKERLLTEWKAVEVPGQVPYKELHVIPMHPITTDVCKKCGLCATLCPVHAIHADNPSITEKEQCISCMRCVKVCPHKARKVDEEKVEKMIEKMKPVCSVPKMCEFFV